MCRVLIFNSLLKKSVNMFERTEIAKSIYQGVVKPYHKNILGQTPTVLISEGSREEKPPSQLLTLI